MVLKLLIKSITSRQRRQCYCAYCKNPRKIYSSKHLSLIAIFGFIFISLIVSELVWDKLEPKSLWILASLLMIGELFSQVRWRQSLICMYCGFDPILYRSNKEKAVFKMQEYIRQRSEQPESLLKPVVIVPKLHSVSTAKDQNKLSTAAGALPERKGETLSLQG